jgi:hypothetical protein
MLRVSKATKSKASLYLQVAALAPLLNAMGSTTYMGPPGNGQHCKMANQITIASTMVGMVEVGARKPGPEEMCSLKKRFIVPARLENSAFHSLVRLEKRFVGPVTQIGP